MTTDKSLSLSELISGVLCHPDCPGELYDAIGECLASLESGPGATDTPAWIQFRLDRYRELEERGH